jgi:hypothetical protein
MITMTPRHEPTTDIRRGDSDIVSKIFVAIATEDQAKLMLAVSPPSTVE